MSTIAKRNRVWLRASHTPLKALLTCGVVAPVLWVVASEVIAPGLYSGYNRISQAISELSATFAPSRPILVPLLVLYQGLVIAFGAGVWQTAHGKRALRVTSGLLMGGGVVGLAALPFPLTQPPGALAGATVPFSDTMHNVLAGGVGPLLMLVTYGFGSVALGMRFRWFSIVCGAATLAGGTLMLLFGAGVLGETPTHWVGAAERLMALVWMLWLAIFAIALLRRRPLTE